jgi:cytochrome c oxidase cbb3-type subunit IV
MNAGTFGAIATVLVTIAFFGVCFWAFSPRLKKRFEEDANLPFADDIENPHTDRQVK